MNTPVSVSIISIFLYVLLATTSFYHYRILVHRSKNSKINIISSEFTLKFNENKKLFFLILSISAILDIPLYIGCISEGGPKDCEWDAVTYVVFFILHLVSLCGYFICLGVPLFLWSDIITGNREVNVESLFRCIDTKQFLFVSIACYGALQLVRVLSLFFASDLTSHTTYQHNEVL